MRRRILYIQYTNPAAYPSLEHSSRILARDGWEVLFLGTGAWGTDALRFPLHEKITVRKIPFCSSSWLQKLHFLWFCLWVFGWTLHWRPQWLYASDPLSGPIGLVLSFLPGMRIIYHEHDSPNSAGGANLRYQIPNTRKRSAFIHFALWVRKKVAHRAQLCILPNQQRAEIFAKEISNNNVFCVWNCPTKDEITPPKLLHKGREIWVLYHGSIVPARLPVTLLKSLVMLPESLKLRVIGYQTVGFANYKRQLQEMVHELGISKRVEFLGAIPLRRELFTWCQQCDIGISLMPKNSKDVNEQNMTGASNKPFDYLACGLALMVSDLPDWRAMYVESGCGLACDPDNPVSIAATLRWFLEHPAEMRKMGERGRQRILSEWNYERQFAPVLEILIKKD